MPRDGDREVQGFLKLGHRNSCERHSQGQNALQILTTILHRFHETAWISSGSFVSLMKAVTMLSSLRSVIIIRIPPTPWNSNKSQQVPPKKEHDLSICLLNLFLKYVTIMLTHCAMTAGGNLHKLRQSVCYFCPKDRSVSHKLFTDSAQV